MDFFISSSPLEEAFLNVYQMISIFGHYNKQSQNIINKKFFFGLLVPNPKRSNFREGGWLIRQTHWDRGSNQWAVEKMHYAKKLHARRAAKEFDMKLLKINKLFSHSALDQHFPFFILEMAFGTSHEPKLCTCSYSFSGLLLWHNNFQARTALKIEILIRHVIHSNVFVPIHILKPLIERTVIETPCNCRIPNTAKTVPGNAHDKKKVKQSH